MNSLKEHLYVGKCFYNKQDKRDRKTHCRKIQCGRNILFGSYARGEATKDSDLDFLVFGGKNFKLTLIFALAEELREAFQKEVDVFEIHEVNRDSAFYSAIMKERLIVA